MIKTQFEEAKGIWLNELPSVLWPYQMMAHTPTGEAPFYLAFGNKAIIPTKVRLTSYRVTYHNEGRYEEGMCLQLDLLNEVRVTAEQHITRY